MRKNISCCLALIMLLSTLSMLAGAVDFSSITIGTSELGIVEPKSFSTATLENDFADDRVLIVLNNKASLNFKEYTLSDFVEIECSAVHDLSNGKKKQVATKVSNFKNSVSTMAAESKATLVEEINKYNQIICLELADKGKANVLAAIKALQSRDDVMYVGPDYAMSLFSTTTVDTHLNDQWAISNINLDGAWDITTGSSNVYVGILDSGIDASHPDLQGRIATALCADFTKYYWQTVPTDGTGHGTHVAGIIAATMDNGKGIAGVASGAKIAALRVFPLDEPGYASEEDRAAFISMLLEALDYAEELGIPILNLSGGVSAEANVSSTVLTAAIENYSGLLICAAGNNQQNNDYSPVYPASIELDNILAVGASTINNGKFSRSNFGATSVDVFAPGDNILSCFPTARCPDSCESEVEDYDLHHADGYHYKSGTSMAAPYVTGIAALMLSENPSLTPQQIKERIIATCTDYSALANKCVSGGVVNACHAVLSAYSSATMSVDSSRSISIAAGKEYWVKVTIPNNGTYSFTTTGSLHTVGELYHYKDGLLERSSNADSATSSNFLIEEYLEAGATVYLKITVKGTPASGRFTLWVS